MKVAWIGLGKLGLPCALALAEYGGHDVHGYDVTDHAAKALDAKRWPHPEPNLARLLTDHPRFHLHGSLPRAVQDAEVVFVAVQTPHAPGYDGSRPTPTEPRDFEYGYLLQALRDVALATVARPVPLTVAVVSTVLPGTCQRLLGPLVRPPLRLAYTPSFIAMGTTIPDFLDPEFVLVGADDPEAYKDIERVWRPLLDRATPDAAIGGSPAPILHTSVVSAETIKVTYNTFLGAKLVFANAIMEVCHDVGADVDEVSHALGIARKRLMSPAYLAGGMGDGGGCHPRDQLAMSWLARRLSLSFDLFGTLMRARDDQTRWLAQLACQWAALSRLPVVVLGKAYKPGTSLTAGSPASLFVHHLDACNPEVMAGWWDPYVDDTDWSDGRSGTAPAVYVVATRHPEFAELRYAPGSVVVDPWRYIPDQPGVTVVRVGAR